MTDDDHHHEPIEAQLRAWAEDAAEQVAPWTPDGSLDAPATTPRRSWWPIAASAAALVLVAAGVGWRVTNDRGGIAVTAANGGDLEVEYERSEYTQHADLQCEARAQETTPTFDRAVYETWADRAGKRWRTKVTYPDGSTRDAIALGSPYYPTELFTRGRPAMTALGCEDQQLLGEPSGIAPVNVMAEIPMIQTPSHAEPFPAVQRFPGNEVEHVEGDHVDSRGRPAELTRVRTTGFGDGGRPIEQVHEMFAEPGTDRMLEITYINKQEGFGSADQRRTVVEHGTRRVDPSIFDTDGYESQGGHPMPPSASESEKTVVVEGKTHGGEPWSVLAFYRTGQRCLEFAAGGKSSTSCDDQPGPVIVKVGSIGEDRVLFGMTMPGVTSLTIDLAQGDPLTLPTSNRAFEKFGYQFYGMLLPPGAVATRVTGFDPTGKQQFVSPELEDCARVATSFETCRADG